MAGSLLKYAHLSLDRLGAIQNGDRSFRVRGVGRLLYRLHLQTGLRLPTKE